MLYGYYGFWDLWNQYHKVTFDGLNKIILVNDGVDSLTVQEIYSSWKEWVKLYDNAKWEPAMRSVGGDQISESVFLGATYFLTNDWRIKPFSRDHRLVVDGNLYTDPSGDSPFIRHDGDYRVLIESTVSALIYSTLAQQEEIEQSAYMEGVTVDAYNSTGKAVSGTTYPIGTSSKPCNNLADALTIARARGFNKLFLKGNLVINSGEDVQNFHIYGQGATLNVTRTRITMQPGSITSLAHFYDARMTGEQGGEGHFTDCIIAGISKSHCHFERCGFVTPATGDGITSVPTYTIQHSSTISNTHITDLHSCYSDETTVVIDRNGTGLNQIYTSFSGRIKFINQNKSSGSGNVWINMSGGTVTIDSTCTTGTFYISGNCEVVNNAVGAVVDTTQVVNSVESAKSVWNANASSYNTAGTMGNKLNTASAGGVDVGAIAEAVRTELTPELTHIMLLENGLNATQATMLQEIYRLYGLDPTKPLIVTQTSRQSGPEITQQITTNASQTVIQRV